MSLPKRAEDAEDLAAFEERADERSVNFETVVRSLRRRGKIQDIGSLSNTPQAQRSRLSDKRRIVNELSYGFGHLAKILPFGCEKLSGHLDRYRVREGSYRIVYSIDDKNLLVDVVKVGHRKDVYR